MSVSLDVRRAIGEANSVFCRFPIQICLPLILFGMLSYSATPFLKTNASHFWLPLLFLIIFGLASFWLDSLIQVIVSSMYLRVRHGLVPCGTQVGEALGCLGFSSLVWAIFFRYLGWLFLLSLIMGVTIGFAGVVDMAIHESATSASGVSSAASRIHTFGTAIGAIVGATLGTLIYSRYMFVLPKLAIAGASGPGFLDDCIAQTKRVWRTASLVLAAGLAPALVFSGVEFLVWKDLTGPTTRHGAQLAFQVVGVFFLECFAAWFVLLKTGLALQLTSAPSLALTVPPPELPRTAISTEPPI